MEVETPAAGAPWYRFEGRGSPVTVEIHRFRAYLPDAHAFAQIQWPTEVGVSKRIHLVEGWESLSRAEQDSAALGAAGAMRAIEGLLSRQGKQTGDGATWPGGLPDFLDDLWTTLEKRQTSTGKPWGHDPTERAFRFDMRNTAAPRTVRTWLTKAKLRPKDIKSGAVNRANYRQFVAEKGR